MKRFLLLLLLLLLLLHAACGSHPEPAPAAKAPQMIAGRYYVEAGAPDPLACTTDADCTIGQVSDDTGCCVREGMPYPQSKAWHDWLAAHREGCHLACPGAMSPPVPAECMVELRCTQGRCANSC